MSRSARHYCLFILLILAFPLLAITIKETEFVGNEKLSDKELSALLTYRNGEEFLYQDANQSIEVIREYYRSKGFIFVKVQAIQAIPVNHQEVKILINIQESSINEIKVFRFRGNYAIKEQIFLDILANKVWLLEDLETIKKIIIDQYALRAYFFAEVKVEDVQELPDGAEVSFVIKENKPFNHKYFQFKGNKISKDYSLIKISRLARNKLLNPALLQQASNRLLAKSYIKKCNIQPLNYESLLIEIEEGKMTTISGIAGYNSKNDTDPFTGFIDFAFNNLFGSDRKLNIKWNKLKKDRSDLALIYHDSGLKDYYFSADLALKRTEYDSLATLSEISASLNYDFISHDVGLYAKYQTYDVIAKSSEEESEKLSAYGVFWQQNFFDNQWNPSTGYQARFSIDYNISSLDNTNYNVSQGYFAFAYPLKNKFVLFNRFNANYSTKKNLTYYNSFKLGGFTSLRGFTEEQFSGYFTSWNNLELRYIFSQDNNLFIFNDAGYLESANLKEITRIGHLYSAGLGLRIATRLGNLTFEYGLGYYDGWNSLYDGLIHFGLETSF